MRYKGKKILLTGGSGFIGNALYTALTKEGALVKLFEGDVRAYDQIKPEIDHTLDYVFHFAAPSSQVLCKRNIRYCVDTTINGFLTMAKFCSSNGVKLIYPSTGVLSQGVENEYARCKKVLEDIHLNSGLDALGLRIFAGYGVGEAHKRDYASVPYLFVRNALNDRQPVIFGDGSQTRDFIYIDDLVRAILVLAEECNQKIVDVGSGEKTSFNQLIEYIRVITDKKIIPEYIEAPKDYVKETHADITTMMRYNCEARTEIMEGIKKIISYEKGNVEEMCLRFGVSGVCGSST
jgi:UDP-glucose 4-epimerase